MTTPLTPAQITNDWLTDALPPAVLGGGRVTHSRIDDIGEGTGIFGDIARVHLTVEGGDGTEAPSVVAKMACTEPANLEVALALGIYDREINMFEHVLDESPMRAPACHIAHRADDGRFIIVMEDMAVDFEVGDQVVGATLEQAEQIVDALAPFHAHWWEHPSLPSLDWLPVPNAPAYRAAVPDIYAAGLPVLQADWTDRVSAESIALAVEVGPKFVELMDRTAGGPTTIIHTDTRLDNIMFAKDPAAADPIGFIDFQLALQGRAPADIAYLVGTSVPQEIAAANWEPLLRRWHDRLTALGVTGYSFDDAVLHYKEAALYYLSGAMSLIGSFDTGNERGAALAHAYSTRILAHVVDIDAGAVL